MTCWGSAVAGEGPVVTGNWLVVKVEVLSPAMTGKYPDW